LDSPLKNLMEELQISKETQQELFDRGITTLRQFKHMDSREFTDALTDSKIYEMTAAENANLTMFQTLCEKSKDINTLSFDKPIQAFIFSSPPSSTSSPPSSTKKDDDDDVSINIRNNTVISKNQSATKNSTENSAVGTLDEELETLLSSLSPSLKQDLVDGGVVNIKHFKNIDFDAVKKIVKKKNKEVKMKEKKKDGKDEKKKKDDKDEKKKDDKDEKKKDDKDDKKKKDDKDEKKKK